MSTQRNVYVTPQAYLEAERRAQTKSEYLDGQVFAMAGASPDHVLIVGNLVTALNIQLRSRPCRVFASDMRVTVSATGLYTYPDALVVCGPLAYDDERKDTLTNPNVIIEVLSPSTEAYDRGEKFDHYQNLSSLTDYILVAQDRPYIDHFVRAGDRDWQRREANRLEDAIAVGSIDCTLTLAEIYAKVAWSGVE
jgi:Uma2 family endonuclease